MSDKRMRLLAAALLMGVLCLGVPALAAQGLEAEYCYTYRLTAVSGPDKPAGETWLDLTVEGTDPMGGPAPALSSGSIALAGPEGMAFTTGSGYLTASFTGEAGSLESGETDGGAYLGWTWYAAAGTDVSGGIQHLGRLTLPGDVDVVDVRLLPWPGTDTGGARYAALRAAADPADRQELTRLTAALWRVEDPRHTDAGYYQGYYQDGGGETVAADIRCGWQGLEVLAYRPGQPLELKLYRRTEGPSGPSLALEAAVSVPDGAQAGTVGRVATLVSRETFTGGTLPEGAYVLTVGKQSHVTAAVTGLTVADGAVLSQLDGRLLYLPCGDLDGDNGVRQDDRAALTRPGVYGSAASGANDPLDLDGDGRIGLTDLAILIDPANYGVYQRPLETGETGGSEA